jgi:PAS domain S-box-containing protein
MHERYDRADLAPSMEPGRKAVAHGGVVAVPERGPHEDQARFESAFNSAPIGMALIDMGGRWLQVNDALCRITGLTRDELRATTLQSITHPDDLDSDADAMHELVDGKVPSCQIEKR